MSDIEKVIAKSNHLQAASLKGAARHWAGLGQGGCETKNGGHGVTPSFVCGEGGREELDISRINAQRDWKLEKIAQSAERFSDRGVEQSGISQSGAGDPLCWGGVPGLDPSEWAQSHPEGTWREEGDRGRLRQCVCVNGQAGMRRYMGHQENRTWGRGNRTESGEGGFRGHTTVVIQLAQNGSQLQGMSDQEGAHPIGWAACVGAQLRPPPRPSPEPGVRGEEGQNIWVWLSLSRAACRELSLPLALASIHKPGAGPMCSSLHTSLQSLPGPAVQKQGRSRDPSLECWRCRPREAAVT